MPVSKDDQELFNNSFHEWLQANGVKLGHFEERDITASINLNQLKAAIQRLRGEAAVDNFVDDLLSEIVDKELESAYDYDYRIAESTIKAHNKQITAYNEANEEVREIIVRLQSQLKENKEAE